MRSLAHSRHSLMQQSPLSARKLQPRIALSGNDYSTFQLCGYTGLLVGFVQSTALVHRVGISQLALLGITGVVILTFFSLVTATKILSARELIIYYHHEITVIAATALFLRLTGQPILPYLDVTALGLGTFLAFGRLGCLTVGCCHGRPCHWGVTYGDQHVEAGFPAYLTGVRLFPIQAVESVFALLVVGCGITAVLKHFPPGTAFGLYVLLYAAGRYCFEFVRGDAARPYLWGFSEAQWTSLAIALGELWAEYKQLVPHYRWHGVIPFVLISITLVVALKRRWSKTHSFELLHPKHVRELAEAIQLAERGFESILSAGTPISFTPGSKVVHLAETSLGVRVSSGEIAEGCRRIRHYSLSQQDEPLSLSSANLLGRTIARLRHESQPFQLILGKRGTFHVVFPQESGGSRHRYPWSGLGNM
jgi:hypothetical protein